MQLVSMPTTTSPTRTTKMLRTKSDEVYVTHATAMRRGAAIADVRRSTLMGGVGTRRLGRARPRREIDRVPCKNRLRTRVDAARASSSRFTLASTSNLPERVLHFCHPSEAVPGRPSTGAPVVVRFIPRGDRRDTLLVPTGARLAVYCLHI